MEAMSNYYQSITKNHHGALLQLEKKFVDMFRREGVVYHLFLFSSTISEGFTNISKTISTSEDEDVWINMVS